MKIKEKFLTTGIGSLPYLSAAKGVKAVCDAFNIPFWPQLPKRSFKENMYVQYAEGLPALIIDEKNRKVHVDTRRDLSEGLGRLYEAYLSEDYDSFLLKKDFAEGFYAFLDAAKKIDLDYIKGHLTGPVSFGLSVVDEKGKSIIYNETLKEAFLKLLEIKAAWQIDRLKEVSKKVIIFIDEPYLTSFGSSFVSIQRQDVILALNALIGKIHAKGGLAGIHCCGNTDWSLFTETEVDIINFDAYSYAGGLSLYPENIKEFLKKGSFLAWGIVPTSKSVLKEDENSLLARLKDEIRGLEKKGIPRKLLISNSLLTPSCGMGTLSEDLTQDIIAKLTRVARLAKDSLI